MSWLYDANTKDITESIVKNTEIKLLEQLNDFISRGLIEVHYGPSTFFRDPGKGDTVTYSQEVTLVLKDKEYIETLEEENKKLKAELCELLNIKKRLENDRCWR